MIFYAGPDLFRDRQTDEGLLLRWISETDSELHGKLAHPVALIYSQSSG